MVSEVEENLLVVSEMEKDFLDEITEVVELKKENPLMSIQTMSG